MKKKKLTTKSKNLEKTEIAAVLEIKKAIETEDAPKKKVNYVDPLSFNKQIILFYKTGVIEQDLGKSIFDIATRLGFKPNFINYVYKEEMIGDAMIKMFTALKNKNFDPKRKNANPFAYFSQIAFNAFKNRIKKEKKVGEVLREYQSEIYERLETEGYIPRQNHHSHNENDYNGEPNEGS